MPRGEWESKIAVLYQSHDAEKDRVLEAGVGQGLSRGCGKSMHGDVSGKSGDGNSSRIVLLRECQDGCPRLPVTAARRMRWSMVRAVIEVLRCRVHTRPEFCGLGRGDGVGCKL
jgi:hypothetical protein